MYPKEEQNHGNNGLDALGKTVMTSTDDRAVWHQNLVEMNDPSMFYNDQFPQMPDFPCMSSSSSSSSNPAPAKPISSSMTATSSSTSSAASWAVLKSEEGDGDGNGGEGEGRLEEVRSEGVVGSGTIDCMDVMENFGYMDLIDGNEIWDPASIFEQNPTDVRQESEVVQGSDAYEKKEGGERLDELGVVFFDWLKSNKEVISVEDMRNIKLKKSTVECASKRLGSSKEGKKQLLKLILEWVQEHQLQRKNSSGGEFGEKFTTTAGNPTTQYNPSHQLPQPPPTPTPPPFTCNSWVPPGEIANGFSPAWIPPGVNGIGMVAAPVVQPPTFSYMGGDYNSGLNCQLNHPYNNINNNNGSGEYQVLESAPSWNPSQITMAGSPYNNQFPDVGNNYASQIMPLAPCYPEQYAYSPVYAAGGGDEQRLVRLGPSATKEARKKRMARQRRTYFHHHHHSRLNQSSHMSSSDHNSHAMPVDDNCSGKSHGGNWLYWQSSPSSTTVVPLPPMEPPHQPSSRPLDQSGDRQPSKQISSDKRQEYKPEKNLKFLLQKVLKQSDVGSLGRIVLPKKEAESHLPDLNSRDGISISMEDIGTSQVWNMRYRFWPNNKSRMYLLENTGDFVKANGLQEGDFIVIYSDVKCGKYLIRGVKVRQPAAAKSEGKKPVKRNYRSISEISARSSPSSPAKIAAT